MSFKPVRSGAAGGPPKSIGKSSEPDTPPPRLPTPFGSCPISSLSSTVPSHYAVLCCARCTFPLSSYSLTSCRRWQKFIVCENVLTSLKSSLRRLPSWIYICVSLIVCLVKLSCVACFMLACVSRSPYSYTRLGLISQSDFRILAELLPHFSRAFAPQIYGRL